MMGLLVGLAGGVLQPICMFLLACAYAIHTHIWWMIVIFTLLCLTLFDQTRKGYICSFIITAFASSFPVEPSFISLLLLLLWIFAYKTLHNSFIRIRYVHSVMSSHTYTYILVKVCLCAYIFSISIDKILNG